MDVLVMPTSYIARMVCNNREAHGEQLALEPMDAEKYRAWNWEYHHRCFFRPWAVTCAAYMGLLLRDLEGSCQRRMLYFMISFTLSLTSLTSKALSPSTRPHVWARRAIIFLSFLQVVVTWLIAFSNGHPGKSLVFVCTWWLDTLTNLYVAVPLLAIADWSVAEWLLNVCLHLSASTPFFMRWLDYSIPLAVFKVVFIHSLALLVHICMERNQVATYNLHCQQQQQQQQQKIPGLEAGSQSAATSPAENSPAFGGSVRHEGRPWHKAALCDEDLYYLRCNSFPPGHLARQCEAEQRRLSGPKPYVSRRWRGKAHIKIRADVCPEQFAADGAADFVGLLRTRMPEDTLVDAAVRAGCIILSLDFCGLQPQAEEGEEHHSINEDLLAKDVIVAWLQLNMPQEQLEHGSIVGFQVNHIAYESRWNVLTQAWEVEGQGMQLSVDPCSMELSDILLVLPRQACCSLDWQQQENQEQQQQQQQEFENQEHAQARSLTFTTCVTGSVNSLVTGWPALDASLPGEIAHDSHGVDVVDKEKKHGREGGDELLQLLAHTHGLFLPVQLVKQHKVASGGVSLQVCVQFPSNVLDLGSCWRLKLELVKGGSTVLCDCSALVLDHSLAGLKQELQGLFTDPSDLPQAATFVDDLAEFLAFQGLMCRVQSKPSGSHTTSTQDTGHNNSCSRESSTGNNAQIKSLATNWSPPQGTPQSKDVSALKATAFGSCGSAFGSFHEFRSSCTDGLNDDGRSSQSHHNGNSNHGLSKAGTPAREVTGSAADSCRSTPSASGTRNQSHSCSGAPWPSLMVPRSFSQLDPSLLDRASGGASLDKQRGESLTEFRPHLPALRSMTDPCPRCDSEFQDTSGHSTVLVGSISSCPTSGTQSTSVQRSACAEVCTPATTPLPQLSSAHTSNFEHQGTPATSPLPPLQLPPMPCSMPSITTPLPSGTAGNSSASGPHPNFHKPLPCSAPPTNLGIHTPLSSIDATKPSASGPLPSLRETSTSNNHTPLPTADLPSGPLPCPLPHMEGLPSASEPLPNLCEPPSSIHAPLPSIAEIVAQSCASAPLHRLKGPEGRGRCTAAASPKLASRTSVGLGGCSSMNAGSSGTTCVNSVKPTKGVCANDGRAGTSTSMLPALLAEGQQAQMVGVLAEVGLDLLHHALVQGLPALANVLMWSLLGAPFHLPFDLLMFGRLSAAIELGFCTNAAPKREQQQQETKEQQQRQPATLQHVARAVVTDGTERTAAEVPEVSAFSSHPSLLTSALLSGCSQMVCRVLLWGIQHWAITNPRPHPSMITMSAGSPLYKQDGLGGLAGAWEVADSSGLRPIQILKQLPNRSALMQELLEQVQGEETPVVAAALYAHQQLANGTPLDDRSQRGHLGSAQPIMTQQLAGRTSSDNSQHDRLRSAQLRPSDRSQHDRLCSAKLACDFCKGGGSASGATHAQQLVHESSSFTVAKMKQKCVAFMSLNFWSLWGLMLVGLLPVVLVLKLQHQLVDPSKKAP